jgi:hypothetical protein
MINNYGHFRSATTSSTRHGSALSIKNYRFKTYCSLESLYKTQMNEFGKRLGVTKHEEWYKVTVRQVEAISGGSRLLKSYGGSLSKALQSIYPEFQFYPWLFERVPVRFWDDLNNQRQYFDWLAKRLNVNHLDGWYNVTHDG